MKPDKSFKDLQHEWYQKLIDEDYVDIEHTNNPDRPLKDWHSFDIPSERFQRIQASGALYQRQIDDFINHPSFPDVCVSLTSHWNCKFSSGDVKIIWELHVDGLTTRAIAKRLGRAKSRIDDILKGIRQWMNLL